ncbi:hypothetical protein GCM10009839_63540 [Catenulispora yoronensis]|uniref:Uncharacterized protein n=1 Tax=Catenulispora yoronensis TaxID=450799 RepID=A0ABP5GN52_9ACTN
MAWLGFLELLVIFGTPVSVAAYVFYRRGGAGGAEHRRRARLIETYTRNSVHDNEVMNEVLGRMAVERQNYRRR